jgi:hypothetical protein
MKELLFVDDVQVVEFTDDRGWHVRMHRWNIG